MARRLLVGVLLVLFSTVANAPAADMNWRKPLAATALVTMTTEEGYTGSCSAFSINGQRGYFMTAAHCLAETMLVDGKPSKVVFVNEATDIMVLEAIDARRPGLRYRTKEVVYRLPVLMIGHAFGWPVAQVFESRVAAPAVTVFDIIAGQAFYMTTFEKGLIGGMSGGPIVDSEGDVVSINQIAFKWHGSDFSGGVPLHKLVELTAQYWGK